jgi:hypothetical protein
MREKAQLADLLQKVGIAVDARAAVLPRYVDPLVELLTRILMRPTELSEMLRYAEYLATAMVVGERATVRDAFGASAVHPLAAKLLADVCGFLVTAAGLRPEFRAAARDRLVVDLTGGEPADLPNTSARATTAANPDAQTRLEVLGPEGRALQEREA